MGTPSRRRKTLNRSEKLGVSYARYSDETQESIEEQEGINEEITADNGVTIVARFSDRGISRSIQDRPDLMAMFRYLEAHPEVGYIAINELERLTAGVSQRGQIIEICQRQQVTLLTEDMGVIDPFDEDKMQEADQRAVSAKGEVLKVQRRVRRNLRQKVINGTVAMRPAFGTRMKPLIGPDGNELPNGVQMVDSKGKRVRSGVLETHPEELPWLLRIFEWADEGVSADEICRRLTASGVKTKSGRDQWRGNTINGILGNPLYKGEMTWGKQAVRRYGDGTTYLQERELGDPNRVTRVSPLGALVDPEVWDRIAARKAANVGLRNRVSHSYGKQLFDGRVFCLDCGNKMYGHNDAGSNVSKVVWRYTCLSNRPGAKPADGYRTTCSKAHSISEKRLIATLARKPTDGPMLVSVHPERNVAGAAEGERRALLKMLADLAGKREREIEMRSDGHITKEQLATRLAAVGADEAAARASLDRLDSSEVFVPDRTIRDIGIDLEGLAARLGDSTRPIGVRIAMLDDAHIERFYVRAPVVEIKFSLGHSGV